MSRSYRKTPCLKDGGRKKHEEKKKASRRFRHATKDQMRKGEFEILPLKSSEITCSWDICDWKSWETLRDAIDTFYRLGPARWWGHNEEEVYAIWKKTYLCK